MKNPDFKSVSSVVNYPSLPIASTGEELSRKGAKRYRISKGFLCAFAREKYFRTEVSRCDLSRSNLKDKFGGLRYHRASD